MSDASGFIPDDQFKPDAAAPAGGTALAAPQAHPGFVPDAQFQPDEERFGGLGQQALTAVEGGAKGLLGPIATGAERLLSVAGVPGLSPGEQAGRAAGNPILHGASEVGGFVLPALVTAGGSAAVRAGLEIPEAVRMGAKALEGVTQAGLLEQAGARAAPLAAKMGIGGPGAGTLGKIGSSAVRGAVENGLYQAGDETSKLINGDPGQSVETAVADVGLASLVGGTLGGGAGAVSSLWRATQGSKAGALLKSVSDHVGGIEGVEPNTVNDLVSKTGMDVAPEVQAALKDDPAVKEMFNVLNQSDTTNSGREFQQTVKDFHQKAGETLAETLGRPAAEIPEDYDKFSHGKTVGTALADEVEERVGPLKGAYEKYADQFAGKDLDPSIFARSEESQAAIKEAETAVAKARGPEQEAVAQEALDSARRTAATPGTVDALQEKIANLARDEKWTLAPDDEIMKAVGSIQKDISNPDFKTLSDLSAYIRRIDEKLPYDPFKGARNRAAGMIKGIFRDAEGELIGEHLAFTHGSEVLDSYRATQKMYGAESQLKDQLEDRLGKLGPTASYGKRIQEMANTDAEALLRKLSGKDDASGLALLQENFPKTAAALREAHVDQILTKARAGDGLSASKVLTQLDKLSPQLRSFIIPPGADGRVEAIGQMLEKLKDTKFNYSGTARSVDKLFQHVPGAAVGIVSMLLGHNPAIGLLLGGLTKYVSKDAPDAVRLALLKWMGSNKPIEAGAFKTMVDFIHSTQRGDSLMNRATKAIFSGASKVIPEHLMPTENEVQSLDKKIKHIDENPSALENVGSRAGHYMPDHAIAMTSTATRVAGYLSSIRPTSIKTSPLDPEVEPNDSEKFRFNRALEIAQQPLVVMQHMRDGTLTTEDVGHLQAMYPGFYSRISQKLTDDMVSHISKGETVPYETRIGVSTLLGQPLDSSLLPQNIISNQAAFAQANQEAQSPGGGKAKPSQVGMRDMKVANRFSLQRQDDNA